MGIHNIITLLFVVLFVAYGHTQDFVLSIEGIDKVEVIARTSVVFKTHDDSTFLISSRENNRLIQDDSSLKPFFGKDNTGFNVYVERYNATLKVESFQPRAAEDLIIYLPETIKVSAENRLNNDIIISDFKNEIEVKANKGDIKIVNVNGPVIAENSKGNTFIVFDKISQNSPISIINTYGDMDITLPSGTKANMEVSVPRGELFTDFELVTAEKFQNEVNPSRYIQSKLNDGGVSISLVASKGNIYLRKG